MQLNIDSKAGDITDFSGNLARIIANTPFNIDPTLHVVILMPLQEDGTMYEDVCLNAALVPATKLADRNVEQEKRDDFVTVGISGIANNSIDTAAAIVVDAITGAYYMNKAEKAIDAIRNMQAH